MMDIVIDSNAKILHTICRPVEKFDETLEKLIQQMSETMTAPTEPDEVRGVGLAAPQVGVDVRIILITLHVGTNKKQKIIAMINPEIVEQSNTKCLLEEGCLSLPGVFGKVSRSKKIKARWQNAQGYWCEKKFDGWDARILLHEYDHLEGVLFTDYLREDQIERK